MPLRNLSILALLFAAASLHADERMSGWPDWMQRDMAREGSDASRTVSAGDDSFTSRMPGKPAAAQAIEGGWYFPSDIGAQSPLECYVFNEAKDLARLVDVIAEANIDVVGTNYGNISNRSVFATDAGAIGGMPWLGVEWLYSAGEAPQAAVGFTKVRAATRDDVALACAHNELGYRETFNAGFASFVENARFAGATAPAAYYEEIAVISVAGQAIGAGHMMYTLDEDGDTQIYRTESSLTPVANDTLSISDLTSISWSKPDGRLINTWSTSVENGSVASELSLRRNDDGDWGVSGTMQQKTIEATLDGSQTPLSELGQVFAARTLFAGDDQRTGMTVWSSSIDPTAFITATLERDDAELAGRGNFTVGPLTYSGQFARDGNMKSADMAMGPISVHIAVVWSRGEMPE